MIVSLSSLIIMSGCEKKPISSEQPQKKVVTNGGVASATNKRPAKSKTTKTRSLSISELEDLVRNTGHVYPELKLQSSSYCLHVVYHSMNAGVYIENQAEAWTEEGNCESRGRREDVDKISLTWGYNGDPYNEKSCNNASYCEFSERQYGLTKGPIICATATVTDRRGNATTEAGSKICSY